MGARKTGGSNHRAHDSKRAKDMAAAGVKRTTFRDPITNRIVPIGTVPGTNQRGKDWE